EENFLCREEREKERDAFAAAATQWQWLLPRRSSPDSLSVPRRRPYSSETFPHLFKSVHFANY
ncbi:hypothetical protein NPIL_358051, partial [Nephila pilipes]